MLSTVKSEGQSSLKRNLTKRQVAAIEYTIKLNTTKAYETPFYLGV